MLVFPHVPMNITQLVIPLRRGYVTGASNNACFNAPGGVDKNDAAATVLVYKASLSGFKPHLVVTLDPTPAVCALTTSYFCTEALTTTEYVDCVFLPSGTCALDPGGPVLIAGVTLWLEAYVTTAFPPRLAPCAVSQALSRTAPPQPGSSAVGFPDLLTFGGGVWGLSAGSAASGGPFAADRVYHMQLTAYLTPPSSDLPP
jgi:hypothetical protein